MLKLPKSGRASLKKGKNFMPIKSVAYGMSKNLLTCQNPRADSWNYIRVKRIPILEPSGVGLLKELLPRNDEQRFLKA